MVSALKAERDALAEERDRRRAELIALDYRRRQELIRWADHPRTCAAYTPSRAARRSIRNRTVWPTCDCGLSAALEMTP